jgi:hypothetical protein
MENKVTLTMKEQHKLKMIDDYKAGKVHAQGAADLLGLSRRQFHRLVAAYLKRGVAQPRPTEGEKDAAGYFLVLQQVYLNEGIPHAIDTDRHACFSEPR